MEPEREEKDQRKANTVKQAIPLKGWRKTLADLMYRCHMEYASVTQRREVDSSEMIRLHKSVFPGLENKYEVKVTYTHLLVKAAAQALKHK